MRLIDADKLPYIKAPIAPILVGDEVVWCNIVYKLHIDNAPTVDAVPVVRCRECKHLSVRSGALGVYQCAIHGDYPYGDYFCADGERKGGDE